MNSSIVNILEILSTNKTLSSAGFSAGYNFDDQNALEYFYELLENSVGATPIFSGIIILEKQEDKTIVIDGLQRLTTISLLLCALCENYKNTTEKNEVTRKKILNMFLLETFNPKLNLAKNDNSAYQNLILNKPLSKDDKKSNIYMAYKTFLREIKNQKISGTELFKTISKIQFMVVQLDDSEVSARELYQALNNKKDKSQVNLISDFITKKGGAASVFWQKTLQDFKEAELEDLLEPFLKNFLMIQNDGKKPNKNALYNRFKSYFGKMSQYKKTNDIVENVCNYAKYYLKIVNADFEDAEIKGQIELLNQNRGYDAYPYLMEVLDDFGNGHINTPVFLEILRMINSFVIARSENPDGDSGIDFANLSQEINKMLVMTDRTPESAEENKTTINEIEGAEKLSKL